MNTIDDYLIGYTGEGAKYWLDFIGQQVEACAKPVRGHQGLFNCNPWVWIGELSKAVSKRVIERLGNGADENIGVAGVVGVILSLWYCRIFRAKCYDSRRPVQQRQNCLARLPDFVALLIMCAVDESHDHVYFPDQQWDNPFAPSAHYEPDDVELKRQAYTKESKKPKKPKKLKKMSERR